MNPVKPKNAQSIIAAPPRLSFTQGLIFSCGLAPGYDGCETYGLAITARCDAANDKVNTYNYLPVVELNDWLHRDGKDILSARLEADALGSLAAILKECGFSPAILQTESPKFVVDQLFPADARDKKIDTARKRAKETLIRYDLAQRAARSSPGDRVCLEIKPVRPKFVAGLLDELVHHKLSGYYFLEQVDVNGEDRGYVVMLREIQSIPRRLTQSIVEGLDSVGFAAACDKNPEFKGSLRVEPSAVSMPVGMLKSPNVEHLMQSFAMLFSRIGINDTRPEYVATLWDRQPGVAVVNL